MADLGAIGYSMFAIQTHVRGGVVSGTVTDSGGSAAAGRVVTTLDRTLYAEGSIPVFDRTITKSDGSYAFAGMDASFSTGPHQYAVLAFDDTTGFPALVLDKVTPA